MQDLSQAALFSLIGNTPLVEVTRLDTGPCRLFLKLESQNPGGSIKDRVGRAMIEAAERDGRLKPGGTVVEATAGNTGLGLALVARIKGYRVVLVVPDKMASEKVLHLKALGAEIHLTRSDVGKGHPEYYQDVAARLARSIPGAWFADQFNNPANPQAHETTTGPEIWDQMRHELDAIVVGVGSSGTLTGLSRFFAHVQPDVEFVLADPRGSILAEYVTTGHLSEVSGSWAVEGIGEDFIPAIADLSRVRAAYTVDDEESFNTARELLRQEGILAGSSTGTLLAAALRYCRAQTTPKRVVTFVCDTGTRYLTKVYSDGWMVDQGLLHRPRTGDLRDLIGRRFDAGEVVTVAPGDTLLTAFNRMRGADLAQLPVVEGGRLVGLIDESDLLLHVTDPATPEAARFAAPVSGTMTAELQTLAPNATMQQLRDILDRGLTAVILDGDRFYGLITRFDLLNHLRRTLT
jgi:cystathionine beta-synthase